MSEPERIWIDPSEVGFIYSELPEPWKVEYIRADLATAKPLGDVNAAVALLIGWLE